MGRRTSNPWNSGNEVWSIPDGQEPVSKGADELLQLANNVADALYRITSGGAVGGTGGAGPGTSVSINSIHTVNWDFAASGWRHNGAIITQRPPTGRYVDGGYVIWDSSLDVNAPPPQWAVPGDKWFPHPDANI